MNYNNFSLVKRTYKTYIADYKEFLRIEKLKNEYNKMRLINKKRIQAVRTIEEYFII
jgi:hypothetical protein